MDFTALKAVFMLRNYKLPLELVPEFFGNAIT